MNLGSRAVHAAAIVLLAATVGCHDKNADARKSTVVAGDAEAAPDSMGVAPNTPAIIAIKTTRNLRENSALALSATQPGVLFTINDSGNEPTLFALDTSGADRGAWHVKRATNADWEALATASCGGQSSARCVYIGDVGDNDAQHQTRTIYRVPEPEAKDARFDGSVNAEHVTFTYSDEHHDVEAMYVPPNGDVLLITKRPLRTSAGRLRPALVFRIPAGAWSSKQTTTAELVDSLPIVPGSAPLRTITDASLSSDARHLAVRTYTQLFVFATDASTGRVNAAIAPAICNLTPLGEAQGEGVTWLVLSGRFAFSSEGRDAALYLATCPVPR